MRVVVVGATGNVGTSLLQVLADEPAVESVVGVARRRPDVELPKTEWFKGDVVHADLARLFRGADAVVHLAWLIQPGRDRDLLWRVNVDGSSRVFRAIAEARVPALIYASSVGVYSPALKTAVSTRAGRHRACPRASTHDIRRTSSVGSTASSASTRAFAWYA